jgi:3-oxoadipate enol-lactonase
MSVWYDLHGDGPPVALLHAGVADSRMWEPQVRSFPDSRTVLRIDFPGFGRSPIDADELSLRNAVREAMDAVHIERAALVGTSLGARIALELALESPERASALVLVGPGLDGHDWSDEVRAVGAEEEAALARGDLEAAIDASLRMWLAGPRRSLDAIGLEVQRQVAEMQRDAFRLQKGHDDLRIVPLEPPASERLGEVGVPTLVVSGDEDVGDIHQIAEQLVAGIPGARRATIAEAAHLPNLERPDEFDRIVLAFLAEHGV